jgi:hypothetical protein
MTHCTTHDLSMYLHPTAPSLNSFFNLSSGVSSITAEREDSQQQPMGGTKVQSLVGWIQRIDDGGLDPRAEWNENTQVKRECVVQQAYPIILRKHTGQRECVVQQAYPII